VKRAFLAAAVALLGLAAVWSVSADNAGATPSDKVMICHATASASNPYTSPDVNTSSIDEENNQYLNGHGDHENDIIPPFTSPAGTYFPGLNWADGQAIWENGCVPVESPPVEPPPVEPPPVEPPPVEPPPVEVTVAMPTASDPSCFAPGEIVIPQREGLEYTETVGPDEVIVTVSAAAGFVLPPGATTSWTFSLDELAQLDPDDPRCVASEPPTPPAAPPQVDAPPAVVPPQVDAQGPVPPAAVPTALPATGHTNWLIALIGLASMMTGVGLVTLSRRTA